MSNSPYCKSGSRRCPISKQCIRKTMKMRRKKRCNTGSRKCVNGFCYKKNKSIKLRKQFNSKYNK